MYILPTRITYFAMCVLSCQLFEAFLFPTVVSMEMSWVWVVCSNPHDCSTVTLCIA